MPELPVSYFDVTYAIGQTLNEMADDDPAEANVFFWALVANLKEVLPNYDWRNSITDTYRSPT